MTNSKISALTSATTPLAGTETLPIVQSSATVKATIANIQAAPISAQTALGVVYLDASKVPTAGTALIFDGTNLGVGATPTQKLYVSGSGAQNFYLVSTTGVTSYLQANGNTSGATGTITNHPFYLVTNSQVAVTVTSSGDLELTKGKLVTKNIPPAITIDSTSSTVTITNGNNIDFINFSGTLMLTETNFYGSSAILLAGGAGSTTVVAQTNGTNFTATSAAGNVRWFYNSGTSAIRLQNNSGSTLVFNITVIKTRSSI